MTNWTFQPTASRRGATRRRRVAEQMELLERAPLFAELPKTHLRKVADASSSSTRHAGDELMKEGQADSVVQWFEETYSYRELDKNQFIELVIEKLEG